MTSKTTKRALLSSALAIVLCLAMLIGSTFAWFTDTASTGVNKIQAGNLKMEVSYKNSENTQFTKVDENTPVLNNSTQWEPGHVEYAVLNVKNAGTLALKYKLGINIASETGSVNVNGAEFKLSDYIKFAVVDGDQSGLDRAALVEAAGEGQSINEGYSAETALKAANDTDTTLATEKAVTLVVWMPETVGNEANYAKYVTVGNERVEGTIPSIDLGINVVATQYNHESDSFGPDYDEFADYPEIQPVTSLDDLKDALSSEDIDGKTIKLYGNIDVAEEQLAVTGKDVAIDLNGNTLTIGKKLSVTNATVVIGDTSEAADGKIATSDSSGVVNAVSSTVTIENGSFVSTYNKENSSGYANVIQIRNSALTINGGYFENTDAVGGYNYLIKVGSYSSSEQSTVTINGGEFVSHRDYGYIVTGDSSANVNVVINGGTFTTTGSYSYLTNVKGTVVVNDCKFNSAHNQVFNVKDGSTVTVKGGVYTITEGSSANLAGFVYCNKNTDTAYGYVPGTIILDPVNTLKINTTTHAKILSDCGVTQSAKDADGFYTITKN